MAIQFYRLVKAPLVHPHHLTTMAVAAEIEQDKEDGTWLLEDGSALAIEEFSELFGVLGWQYGGSETTFNLPPASPGQFPWLIKARSGADHLPVGALMQYMGDSANKMQA